MSINIAAIIITAIIIIILIISIGVTAYKGLVLSKEVITYPKEPDIDRIRILLETDSISKIDGILNTFISNAADIYQILELSQNQKEIITSEDINKMVNYIVASVNKNMTDDTISLLKLIHKLDSPKDINDLIELQTKLYVLKFVVDYNTPI
jgi:hypothetical protein